MGTEAFVAERSRQILYRRFQRLLAEAAQLAETDLPPDEFYRETLQRALAGTGAVAGAIWTRTANGAIQAECENNGSQGNLDGAEHDELLHQAFQTGQPLALEPRAANNPTAYLLLIAPIRVERQAAALIEVRLEPIRDADLQTTLLHFLIGLAHRASLFTRDDRLRTLARQQRIWMQLEEFCRHVHTGLDFAQAAYTVANEGRRLVECDRLSVAALRGRRAVVEAVSGVDTIDPRANQVRLLARLTAAVLKWGEPLLYRGASDETLPPPVRAGLDAYLAESRSLLLIVQPLRETKEAKPGFALVAECFEPVVAPEPLLARLETIGHHAAPALANAASMRGVPLRWLWAADLGNSALLWGLLLVLAVLGLATALVGFSCPLKMDAAGQLLPQQRRWLYTPVEGRVIRFEQGVEPGGTVLEDQALALMYDVQLELKLVQLANDIASAGEEAASLAVRQNTAGTEADRAALAAEKRQKEFLRNRKLAELTALRERTHSDEARPGYFWLKAPLSGTVLNGDFRERLTNRLVKPSEPLVRIGDQHRGWEVELKIPHRNLGQILEGFAAAGELDVDLLLLSAPTRRFRGKLARTQMAGQVSPDPDDAEPSLRASIRIDGLDIPPEERIPSDLLLTGTEVHAKIRCGNRSAAFALFHGVWEFLYEKVLFY